MRQLDEGWKRTDGYELLKISAHVSTYTGKFEVDTHTVTVQAGPGIGPHKGCDFVAEGSSKSSSHCFEISVKKGIKVHSLSSVDSSIIGTLYCHPDNLVEARKALIEAIKDQIDARIDLICAVHPKLMKLLKQADKYLSKQE